TFSACAEVIIPLIIPLIIRHQSTRMPPLRSSFTHLSWDARRVIPQLSRRHRKLSPLPPASAPPHTVSLSEKAKSVTSLGTAPGRLNQPPHHLRKSLRYRNVRLTMKRPILFLTCLVALPGILGTAAFAQPAF